MKAFFTRAEDGRLGLRFEPVTFEEQLLLEMFTKPALAEPLEFQFSSWEHNQPRALGLTSCWGQLVRKVDKSENAPPSPWGTFTRHSTGLAPLDHVLGGGLVNSSVVLLTGAPGAGKTSLALQMLNGLAHRSLYVTGEETEAQVTETARRLGVTSKNIYMCVERSLETILEHARKQGSQTIVIDTIETMICEDVRARAGSMAQHLKECAKRLINYVKTTGATLWINRVPSGMLDHALRFEADTALEIIHGAKSADRILRSFKNRFGSIDAQGIFQLTAKGLVPL